MIFKNCVIGQLNKIHLAKWEQELRKSAQNKTSTDEFLKKSYKKAIKAKKRLEERNKRLKNMNMMQKLQYLNEGISAENWHVI